MSVKLNKNQSTITNTFNPVFQGKCQCRTECDTYETLSDTTDCLSDITRLNIIGLNSLDLGSKIHQGISIIQHFHVGELDCVVHFGELENLNYFNKEWLYRPDFYLGTLQGQFTRGTETGCSSGMRKNDLNTTNQRL